MPESHRCGFFFEDKPGTCTSRFRNFACSKARLLARVMKWGIEGYS
ncbi:hypothetical protein ACPOL_2525 [Acidisarcina polymorpha]|uniref:Uncharacterized protein n=1 Tax=Acidisarcina polymorpha TaxID=2211140 RepID=A0A2Z5FZL7_9BACT|nr:hypothetical protein ACPOL_2525 [Acidisarcina polymorpha]